MGTFILIVLIIALFIIVLSVIYKNRKPLNRAEFLAKRKKKEYYELKKINDLYEIERAKNEAWQKEWNELCELTQLASKLEKEQNTEDAISTYLKAIEFGENSSKLNFTNYAHSIDRIVILYSKTKQKELLKSFLEKNIKKYPERKNAKVWSIRLQKLTM